MKITFEDGRWYATQALTQTRSLQTSGWLWDAERRRWFTTTFESVEPFQKFCVGEARDFAQKIIPGSQCEKTPEVRLYVEGDRFILNVGFSNRSLAKEHYFRWDAERKHWFTESPHTAYLLKDFGDRETAELLDRIGKPRLWIENDSIYFVGPFMFSEIAREAGMAWDSTVKAWKGRDLDRIRKLLDFADPEVRSEIERIQRVKEETILASRASEGEVQVWSPRGKEYLPFQKAGILFGLRRKNILIADEPGLGKTIQAIGILNGTPRWKKVLVIVPANLKINWKREFTSWLFSKKTVEVATGKYFPDSEIVILNYDILGRHIEKILQIQWDFLVLDEAHYCKNPKSTRTKLVSSIDTSRKIILTGTPILNRPIELYPLLTMLDPDRWNRFWDFAGRFCAPKKVWNGTKDVWDFSGASNLEELQEILRGSCMIRRLKKDVLLELPPKRRQILEFPIDEGFAGFVEAERIAVETNRKIIEDLAIRAELAKVSDDPEHYRKAVERLKEAEKVEFEEISRLRHRTALAKIPSVCSLIEEILDSERKLIVFAHHTDVIESIAARFPGKAVTLTGKMTPAEKQRSADLFVNDAQTRIFIGSIYAAGVGFTLTVASRVLFAELDWVPGIISQAEDRAHRISQINPVWIQHLVVEGSIDARMARIILEKQEIMDRALDRRPERKENVQAAFTKPVSERTKPCTATVTPSLLELTAAKLTDREISEIHQNLKVLAARCDGAAQNDGQGFSKIDAGIGHSLARQGKLTPKQAALGQKILQKYRRQLSG